MNKTTALLMLFLLPLALSAQDDLGKKAHQFFVKKEYKEAVKAFTEAIESYDNENQKCYSYHYRGFCHYELGNARKAIADLEKALELDKNDQWYNRIAGDSHSLLNRTWEKLGDIDKAMYHLEKAIEIAPEDSHLWNNLSLMQFDQGLHEEALENVDKAIELNEKDPYAWSNRAKYLLFFERTEEAFHSIEKALELAPNNPYAYKHRAMAHIKNKNLKKACNDLKKAKELDYNNFGGGLEDIDADEVDQLLQAINCGT